MSNLPNGIEVLAWTGDGPAPIERVLAACPQETDPERRGLQLLLACVLSITPDLPLDELVVTACRWFPVLGQFEPTLVADVARQMGAS